MKKKVKLNVRGAGGKASANTLKYQLTIPCRWAKEMGIIQQERKINIYLKPNEIVICKNIIDEENHRILQVNVRDNGCKRGYLTYKLDLPPLWIKEIGIPVGEPLIELEYKNQCISLKKYKE